MRLPVLVSAALLLVAVGPLSAQESVQNYSSVATYAISFPSGDARDFVNTPSWIGFMWDGVWRVRSNTTAGVSFGVHNFSRSSFGTSNYEWGATTGEESRTLVVTTAMATGRWYPDLWATRRLHVGLGAGLAYSSETYQVGLLESVRGAAHLAIAPEAGWTFPLLDGVDAMVSARYTLPASGGSYLAGSRHHPFATLGFGLLEH
jgi:hypothetical protein